VVVGFDEAACLHVHEDDRRRRVLGYCAVAAFALTQRFVGRDQFPGAFDHAALQILVEMANFALGALALDELADLAADGGEHLQQVLVRLADLTAEKLDYPQHLAPQADRKAEGSMKSAQRRAWRPREILVLEHVRNPG